MANKSDWKGKERRVARALGFERNPNNGESRTDINAGPFSIEHKAWNKAGLPKWFTGMMDQARRAAFNDGTTGIAVITHSQGRGVKAKRYVVMLFEDFVAWHGPTPAAPDELEAARE